MKVAAGQFPVPISEFGCRTRENHTHSKLAGAALVVQAQPPPNNHYTYEEWAGEKIRAIIPLGRWQTAEDIANMVIFLSSDRTAQVTGQTLNVDGGFVLHW